MSHLRDEFARGLERREKPDGRYRCFTKASSGESPIAGGRVKDLPCLRRHSWFKEKTGVLHCSDIKKLDPTTKSENHTKTCRKSNQAKTRGKWPESSGFKNSRGFNRKVRKE